MTSETIYKWHYSNKKNPITVSHLCVVLAGSWGMFFLLIPEAHIASVLQGFQHQEAPLQLTIIGCPALAYTDIYTRLQSEE